MITNRHLDKIILAVVLLAVLSLGAIAIFARQADGGLYQYASIFVNGEYWGVCLALEAVEESFALRNYGVDYGNFYKPDSMEMGGAGKMEQADTQPFQEGSRQPGGQFAAEGDALTSEESAVPVQGQPPAAPEGLDFAQQPSGRGGQSGAAALNYVDDQLDSYSVIWDSEVFPTSDSDHARVVQALQQISKGENLEQVMDVDNLLRYLAVHTFVVNLDSLSGNMAHNYYLYEEDGVLNLIPWDYNLAFGGFQSGDASDVVNFPIDTPFSDGVSLEDRQFFVALLSQEEYLEQYHNYLAQLTQEYVAGGKLEQTYQRIRQQIDALVAEDPTSFYSYDAYDQAAQMLYQTILLRAQSVDGQLNGTIPSTSQAQQEDASALVDASSIDLSVMGTMMGGGRGESSDKVPQISGQASDAEQPPTRPDAEPASSDTEPATPDAEPARPDAKPANPDAEPAESQAESSTEFFWA